MFGSRSDGSEAKVLFLDPAPVGNRGTVGPGRDFQARLQLQQQRRLVFENDAILQEDNLLEKQQRGMRRYAVNQIHHGLRAAQILLQRLDEKRDGIEAVRGDASSIAYRRWLKEKGIIYGTNIKAA